MVKGIWLPFFATSVAFGVSLLFMAFPTLLAQQGTPAPFLFAAFFFVFGLLGLVVSALAFGHAVRQARIKLRVDPIMARFAVKETSDSDSTTYELHIRSGKTCWIVPVYDGKGVKYIQEGGGQTGQVWLDPKSNLPLAAQVDALSLVTYPRAICVSAEQCLV